MIKSYEKYKPSGVEWIGKIPEHWNIRRIKFLTYNLDAKRIPLSSDQRGLKRGDYPYYGATGIIDYIDEFTFEGKYVLVGEDGAPFFIKNRDVAFVAEGKFWVNNHAHILESNGKLLPELLARQLNLVDYRAYISGSTRDKLTQSELNEIRLIDIPKEEQTAIANYLDEKTAQIDTLIDNKQELIELLKEERVAIINQAVTKGINPKTKLKPSGIEWLGDIPAHWEVKKLKYVAKIVLGKMLTNNDKGNYQRKPYLRAANLLWFNVDVSNVKEMWFSSAELNKLRLRKDDLLVSEGGEVGRTCIWKEELEECYIQNSVHKITITSPNEPKFFLYLFYSLGQRGIFESMVNRISIAHLTGEKMKEIVVIVPIHSEQAAVVHHIESNTTRIEATISKIEKEIEFLQEYRTALISEVVTGKIRVI